MNLRRIVVWRKDVPLRVQHSLCAGMGIHPPQACFPHRGTRLSKLQLTVVAVEQLECTHRPRIVQLHPHHRLLATPLDPLPLAPALARRTALLQPQT